MSAFTDQLLGMMPATYTKLDTEKQFYRYLDGFGSLGQKMSDISDGLWEGKYTTVGSTPAPILRWIAQILGVPAEQRSIPENELRTYLADIVTSGGPRPGTRKSIANATKRFMLGSDKQVTVKPDSQPHTILILVRADQVNDQILADLPDNLRKAGVIPAGHDVIVKIAQATWNSYEAAVGADWKTADSREGTWTDSDSLGVVVQDDGS